MLANSAAAASTASVGSPQTTDAPWPMIGHGASVCLR